jgi:hypothetical protein
VGVVGEVGHVGAPCEGGETVYAKAAASSWPERMGSVELAGGEWQNCGGTF